MDDENPHRDVLAAFTQHQAAMDRVAWRLLVGLGTIAVAFVLHLFRVF